VELSIAVTFLSLIKKGAATRFGDGGDTATFGRDRIFTGPSYKNFTNAAL
jgi:hypothetical protein